MFLLLAAYLFFKGILWCLAALVWMCLAFGGWSLVLLLAALVVVFDPRAAGRLLRSSGRAFAPPIWLHKSHT